MPIATQGLHSHAGRSEDLRLCVWVDDEAVLQALRLAYPEPHTLLHAPLTDLLDAQHDLSVRGHEAIQQAKLAQAVLVEWRLDVAPVVNTLGFHLRLDPVAPLIGVCRTGDEEVPALAAGCDAAITFPLRTALVQSMVLAHRRLMAATTAARGPGSSLDHGHSSVEQQFGPLRLNRTAGRLFVNHEEVQLTPREYALLDFLLRHVDELCTRDEILAQVWGIDFDTGTNMVDVYMYFLRKKLEVRNAAGLIQTVRGRGYRLSLPPEGPDVEDRVGPNDQPASANAGGH